MRTVRPLEPDPCAPEVRQIGRPPKDVLTLVGDLRRRLADARIALNRAGSRRPLALTLPEGLVLAEALQDRIQGYNDLVAELMADTDQADAAAIAAVIGAEVAEGRVTVERIAAAAGLRLDALRRRIPLLQERQGILAAVLDATEDVQPTSTQTRHAILELRRAGISDLAAVRQELASRLDVMTRTM